MTLDHLTWSRMEIWSLCLQSKWVGFYRCPRSISCRFYLGSNVTRWVRGLDSKPPWQQVSSVLKCPWATVNQSLALCALWSWSCSLVFGGRTSKWWVTLSWINTASQSDFKHALAFLRRRKHRLILLWYFWLLEQNVGLALTWHCCWLTKLYQRLPGCTKLEQMWKKQATQTVTTQSESGIRLHLRNKQQSLLLFFFSVYTPKIFTWGNTQDNTQFTLFEISICLCYCIYVLFTLIFSLWILLYLI